MTKCFPLVCLAVASVVMLPSSVVAEDQTMAGWPVKGKVESVTPVQDRLGNGFIVYSKFSEQSDEPFGVTETVHAYRFNGEGRGLSKIWQINDGVELCGCDGVGASFAEGMPTVTDLDGNGLKEVWTAYFYTCQSEGVADDFKIIMYEGRKKYAMRGFADQAVGKMDAAFKSGPASFRSYADGLWKRLSENAQN
ncbi:MAG: hypothetical protein K6E40_13370 [Desulfovibrio sp.]|nr:hypothetical protein [Desulfovibrio sp.]